MYVVEPNWKRSRQHVEGPGCVGRCCPCDSVYVTTHRIGNPQTREVKKVLCLSNTPESERGTWSSWAMDLNSPVPESVHFTCMLSDASSRDDPRTGTGRREGETQSPS